MMRLPMYHAALELAETFIRREPSLGDETDDDATGAGGVP